MCLSAFSYMAVSENVCVMIFLAEFSNVYWNALRNLRTSFWRPPKVSLEFSLHVSLSQLLWSSEFSCFERADVFILIPKISSANLTLLFVRLHILRISQTFISLQTERVSLTLQLRGWNYLHCVDGNTEADWKLLAPGHLMLTIDHTVPRPLSVPKPFSCVCIWKKQSRSSREWYLLW